MNLHSDYELGTLIKQKRISASLTLQELSARSGVSQSYIGRIERGERFPSARTLKKIAKPLGFEEEELFTLAGLLSNPASNDENMITKKFQIDPSVASMLAREPVELQRVAIDIFNLLKMVAKNLNEPGNKKP